MRCHGYIPLPAWKIRQALTCQASARGCQAHTGPQGCEKGVDKSQNIEEFGGKVCYG